MSRPRLLLVPWIGELEWSGIRPQIEAWADVAAHDPPGVGDEPLPDGVTAQPPEDPAEADLAFDRWRQATADRALAGAEERGWDDFVVVADALAHEPAVRVAEAAPDRVRGLALGHASLANTLEGERPTISKGVWDTMASLMRTDQRAFIGYGIAQLTQGAVDDELAGAWLDRIPDASLVVGIWEAIGRRPEPLEERLRELGLPLLLAKHRGCLLKTEQGYEDAVRAFPEAHTVTCPEACAASPAFAAALREFCSEI